MYKNGGKRTFDLLAAAALLVLLAPLLLVLTSLLTVDTGGRPFFR